METKKKIAITLGAVVIALLTAVPTHGRVGNGVPTADPSRSSPRTIVSVEELKAMLGEPAVLHDRFICRNRLGDWTETAVQPMRDVREHPPSASGTADTLRLGLAAAALALTMAAVAVLKDPKPTS